MRRHMAGEQSGSPNLGKKARSVAVARQDAFKSFSIVPAAKSLSRRKMKKT
jgi:hypothetical protein